MNRSIVLVGLLLVGCGDDDSGSGPHDAAVVDTRSVDADPSCRQWRRESVPLEDVVSLEALPIHPERSARMLVDVLQCPGDLPAMPEYGFTLENEYVSLTMSVWRTLVSCTAPVHVQRPVTIRFLYPGSWKFVLAGGGTRTISVVAAPSGTCNTSLTQCERDCDCTQGVCLSAMGLGGAFARCAVPCELDRDCNGDGTCESAADELSFVCAAGTECASPVDCPIGFACNSGRCEPTFQLNSSTRHDCTCDADCDPGLRCTFHEGIATGTCEALCLTASSGWCQGPHVCGAGSVEPDRGVCGWVGE